MIIEYTLLLKAKEEKQNKSYSIQSLYIASMIYLSFRIFITMWTCLARLLHFSSEKMIKIRQSDLQPYGHRSRSCKESKYTSSLHLSLSSQAHG